MMELIQNNATGKRKRDCHGTGTHGNDDDDDDDNHVFGGKASPGKVAKNLSENWLDFYNFNLGDKIKDKDFGSSRTIDVDYSKLKDLKWISIEYCPTDTLPAELFALCPKLQHLMMCKEYYRIPGSWLSNIHLTMVTFLNISDMQSKIGSDIESNEEILTHGFLHLEKLAFTGCDIRSIDSWIYQLRNLDTLEISNAVLEMIPPEITELQNLVDLNLSKNRIRSIPNELFSGLTSLKALDLSCNEISILDRSVSNLQSLEFLNLCQNKLQRVPSSLGRMLSLVDLTLLGNELQCVPIEIGKLTSLEYLSLTVKHSCVIPYQVWILHSSKQQCDIILDVLDKTGKKIIECKRLVRRNR